MGKSGRLRLKDVRAAFRLLGECRDLGADSLRWRERLFDGLSELLGTRVGIGGEFRWLLRDQPMEPVQFLERGLEPKARDLCNEYIREHGASSAPQYGPLSQIEGVLVTRTRRQLIADRDWYRSPFFRDNYLESGIDHSIVSVNALDAGGTINFISLYRTLRERDFSVRERRLLHLFHEELGPLIGPTLARADEEVRLRSLSPRLRQTLSCLLEGDSEKQAAARLGLSPTTVHQYVTALYRYFHVHSRAELLAHFLRRHRQGPG